DLPLLLPAPVATLVVAVGHPPRPPARGGRDGIGPGLDRAEMTRPRHGGRPGEAHPHRRDTHSLRKLEAVHGTSSVPIVPGVLGTDPGLIAESTLEEGAGKDAPARQVLGVDAAVAAADPAQRATEGVDRRHDERLLTLDHPARGDPDLGRHAAHLAAPGATVAVLVTTDHVDGVAPPR